MNPRLNPRLSPIEAFQNVTPINTELHSVDKSDAENVTPIVTPDVTPDKVASKVKDNHERRQKRFRYFCAPESNERKMIW